MSFLLPKGPLLGLGEGGVQFDKKGSTDQMRNGQVTRRPTATGSRSTARARRCSGSSARTAGACSSTSRTARSISQGDRRAGSRRRAAHRAAARRLRRGVARSDRHHARVRAHHRPAGDAGALDVRLHAVVAHARRPGRDPRRREDVPREEAAVRHADLSRHRVRAVGLEHAQRRVHLASDELSRSEEDDRRAARRSLQGHRARRRRRPAIHRHGERSVHGAAAAAGPHGRQSVAARSPGVLLLARRTKP